MTERKVTGETYAEFAIRHQLNHGDIVVEIRGINWEYNEIQFRFESFINGKEHLIYLGRSGTGSVLAHSFLEPVEKEKLKKIVMRQWFSKIDQAVFWRADGVDAGKLYAVCNKNGVQNTREIWVKE
jgi:hypothetical protein